MRPLLLLMGVGAVIASVAGVTPARALTTICTPGWTGGSVPQNTTTPATAIAGAAPGCPTSTTVAVTVGSGGNSGTINSSSDAIAGNATSSFTRTSTASVDIGVPTSTAGTVFTVSFSTSVLNPYLFFTYTDGFTGFRFLNPFVLAQQNNVTRNGSTVNPNGGSGAGNTQDDGFVVQMIGAYDSVDFLYESVNGFASTVSFTAGVQQAVPAPLPLMGAGVAFGFSRRLRRRIRAGS